MSYHAHKNSGKAKSLFLSLSNSYHGETLGALAVGDVALYKETYAPLLIHCIQTPVPCNQSMEAALEALQSLEVILNLQGSEISAFIVEPLVQGAGGMKMYHPYYLTHAKQLCKEYNVHFIADEIMTGFGRTGTMFACEQAGITPDFLILSKGLTGGYLPLSVVMTTEEIYNTFYCDYDPKRSFLHSHSYTGNAIACAAANATLDIFETNACLENNTVLSAILVEELERFAGKTYVKEIRQCGMIGVIELIEQTSHERIGVKIHRHCLSNGVLIRPLGNVIYVMPPYVITPKELRRVFEVIDLALTWLDV
jgi:adenosylmethionine-8-amino-7-oxononanoate aminotransferase